MRDTIDMAREAFTLVKGESWNSGFWTVAHEELKAFEALVRADERKQIALEQRTWVGLTAADIKEIWKGEPMLLPWDMTRTLAIEAKLKEKNT